MCWAALRRIRIASATAVYGAERFAKLYGVISPIPAARVRVNESLPPSDALVL